MQPDKLGRYEILEELGRGAMGRVFLAHDPQIDRKVAIKTVQVFESLPSTEQAEARERFLVEARAAGKLAHPGIVTMYDVGMDEGVFFLAMEYVQGSTLDHYCRKDGLLPLEIVTEMIAGVAEALHEAHRQDVVHRDIKPANLMRVGEGAVKIMDFGLARASEGQLTQDGALVGTPSYMSPEQIRGETVDGRSDLFSLAVVLYEMLSGERPFPGDSISSIIYRIVNEEPREATEVSERVPASLGGFLNRALSKRAEDRFADGQSFAQELRRLTGQPGKAPAPVAHDPQPRGEPELPPALPTRRRRTSARPYVLAAIALIVLAAGLAYHFRETLGLDAFWQAEEIWWEATVRTEPLGVEVLLDGNPLDPALAGLVRFRPEPPFGVLTAQQGCRRLERPLDAADAGTEIVLVFDPETVHGRIDPGVERANVTLNGESLGVAPLDVELDLCQSNQLEIEAEGFLPASLEVPEQATPLEARTLLAGVQLSAIPMGIVELPRSAVKVVYYLDGQRVDANQKEFELPAGTHELRLKNEAYWIDVTRRFDVTAGERVVPEISTPALTTLVVQAFPSNCKVYLRRPGGRWKFLDDTPLRSRVSVGRYEVRVKLNPTGETREQEIDLAPGDNPPVRVSFGRGS